MMRLKPSDSQKKCVVTYIFNSKPEEIPGMILYRSNQYYLFTNHAAFNGSKMSNMYGYLYAYAIGIEGEALFGGGFVDLRFLDSNILCKRDSSNGFLFRRLYKNSDGISFLGPIKKDPDECKLLSSVITVMDSEFLKSKGWAVYETEISAEQRAELASKSTK